MPAVDAAIVHSVETDLLTPQRIVAAVKVAREQLAEQRHDLAATGDELDARLLTLTAEIDRLTLAIAQGAALDATAEGRLRPLIDGFVPGVVTVAPSGIRTEWTTIA